MLAICTIRFPCPIFLFLNGCIAVRKMLSFAKIANSKGAELPADPCKTPSLTVWLQSQDCIMTRNVWKSTFRHMRPTKTQISPRRRTVWSELSIFAWRNFASLAVKNRPSEDSDQTARMRRLIRIFAGRTCTRVRFLTLHLLWFLNQFYHWAIFLQLPGTFCE